ncbi:hypothetical protein [Mycolicibacterium peregrinum]|uniref:hypothetical protein n=1 Tax=Mycolicibacterium peregrinum TaxID=43304 RepID=UPI001A7E0E21|nr:hypothetical protein [Mycolicibacterium peregrinum]
MLDQRQVVLIGRELANELRQVPIELDTFVGDVISAPLRIQRRRQQRWLVDIRPHSVRVRDIANKPGPGIRVTLAARPVPFLVLHV